MSKIADSLIIAIIAAVFVKLFDFLLSRLKDYNSSIIKNKKLEKLIREDLISSGLTESELKVTASNVSGKLDGAGALELRKKQILLVFIREPDIENFQKTIDVFGIKR